MPPVESCDEQLEITDVAYGGKGIAKHDGKVFFVEGGIPGDIVRVDVTKSKKSFAEAKISDLIQPSPLRGESKCPVSHVCGGCQWQGIPYDQQLTWKSQFIASSMERIGKIPMPSVDVTPSPLVHNYRSRVLLRCHIDRDGKVKLGFFKTGTRELVAISTCAIADENINTIIEEVGGWQLVKLAGKKFRLELQSLPGSQGQCFATLFPADRKDDDVLRELAEQIGNLIGVAWAGVVFDQVKSPSLVFDENQGIKFLTTAGQFQQVNNPANRIVQAWVKEQVATWKPATLLDVFCGSGNLSLPVAEGISCFGVEANPRSIACAKGNADANNLPETYFTAQKAHQYLKYLLREKQSIDCVIADPPREGLGESLEPLIALKPKYLIYVSCDPSTLARDLSRLVAEGYTLASLRGIDFFPNTYHIESVAVLEAN